MAQKTNQKKTTAAKRTTAAKSTSRTAGSAKQNSPAKTPRRREVMALLCFLLSIFTFIGYWNSEGAFIGLFCGFAKGLIGRGFYALPPVLFLCAAILTFHRGRPVRLRTISALVLTVIIGAMLHLFLETPTYEMSLEMFAQLWHGGRALEAGGVISGGLSELFQWAFAKAGAGTVFICAAFFFLLAATNKTIAGIIDWIKARERREYILEPEPEPRQREPRPREQNATAAQRTKTESIDIPIDENAGAKDAKQSGRRGRVGFFSGTPRVKTPDQLITEYSPAEREAKQSSPDAGAKDSAVAETVAADISAIDSVPSDPVPSDPIEAKDNEKEEVIDMPLDIPFMETRTASSGNRSSTASSRAFGERVSAFVPPEMPTDTPVNMSVDMPTDMSTDMSTGVQDGSPNGGKDQHEAASALNGQQPAQTADSGQSAEALNSMLGQISAVEGANQLGQQTIGMPFGESQNGAGQRESTDPMSASDTIKGESTQGVDDGIGSSFDQSINEEIAEPIEVYNYPPLDLLTMGAPGLLSGDDEEVQTNSQRLESAFRSFGVNVTISNTTRGPAVTRYEAELEAGIKLSRLTGLADDIALSLGASGVRIAAMPNKISTVGIEVPNKTISTVNLRDIIESNEFQSAESKMTFAVGMDISGEAVVGNISKLPHLLVAGTTGSGKSVCLNSLILSILYKATPEEVRFIMIDPKMVEFKVYNSIPHLLVPVVTDVKKASGALQWAVVEMMKRYALFSETNARDIEGFNQIARSSEEYETIPHVIVVIDELADLMMMAAKEVEESVCRVAQMGRAAGMHLVIATQSPRADVITGLMKANIPSRIALKVSSALESRIILDAGGNADKLVGNGDMLYAPIGTTKPLRVQGTWVSDKERENVVEFIKSGGESHYSDEVIDEIEKAAAEKSNSEKSKDDQNNSDYDELVPQAVEVIFETKQASVSMLQRRLKLGYSRAARIVDQLEEMGIVGPFEGSKPRTVLVTRDQWHQMQYINGTAPVDKQFPTPVQSVSASMDESASASMNESASASTNESTSASMNDYLSGSRVPSYNNNATEETNRNTESTDATRSFNADVGASDGGDAGADGDGSADDGAGGSADDDADTEGHTEGDNEGACDTYDNANTVNATDGVSDSESDAYDNANTADATEGDANIDVV